MNRLLVHVTLSMLLTCAAVVADDAAAPATEALGRNVRLDFKLLPLENEHEKVFIVTASPWYETSLRFRGPEIEVEFAVSGTIELLDGEKIFIHCDGELGYEGEDVKAEINILCSVILEPGVDFEIAKMGEKTLVVRSSFIE